MLITTRSGCGHHVAPEQGAACCPSDSGSVIHSPPLGRHQRTQHRQTTHRDTYCAPRLCPSSPGSSGCVKMLAFFLVSLCPKSLPSDFLEYAASRKKGDFARSERRILVGMLMSPGIGFVRESQLLSKTWTDANRNTYAHDRLTPATQPLRRLFCLQTPVSSHAQSPPWELQRHKDSEKDSRPLGT